MTLPLELVTRRRFVAGGDTDRLERRGPAGAEG